MKFWRADVRTLSLCRSGLLYAGHVALHHTCADRSLAQADLWTAQREVKERDGKLPALWTGHWTGATLSESNLKAVFCIYIIFQFCSLLFLFHFLQSVWVKKGSMQWWRDWKPHKWLDVQFALEQFSGSEGNKDGILFIYYTFNDEKKVISTQIWEHSLLLNAHVNNEEPKYNFLFFQ